MGQMNDNDDDRVWPVILLFRLLNLQETKYQCC